MSTRTPNGPQGAQPPGWFWAILLIGIGVGITGVIVKDSHPVLGWAISFVGIVGATLAAFLVAKKKGYATRR